MGETPCHRRTWHAARGMIALTIAFALIVAPFVVILTHGPAAHANVASVTVEIAEKITAHRHSHDEGHSHDEAGHDGSFAGHNPADHDHQLQALVCKAANAPIPMPDKNQCVLNDVFRHLTLEGPMRPPRSV